MIHNKQDRVIQTGTLRVLKALGREQNNSGSPATSDSLTRQTTDRTKNVTDRLINEQRKTFPRSNTVLGRGSEVGKLKPSPWGYPDHAAFT